MTDPQLVKIIQRAVKDEVRPLKEQVEIVKSKINTTDIYHTANSSNIKALKEQQSVINEKLDALPEIKEFVENRVYPSLLEIELAIKAYGDMYKLNNDNAKRLDNRLKVAEDKLGIHSPPEFSLSEVS